MDLVPVMSTSHFVLTTTCLDLYESQPHLAMNFPSSVGRSSRNSPAERLHLRFTLYRRWQKSRYKPILYKTPKQASVVSLLMEIPAQWSLQPRSGLLTTHLSVYVYVCSTECVVFKASRILPRRNYFLGSSIFKP